MKDVLSGLLDRFPGSDDAATQAWIIGGLALALLVATVVEPLWFVRVFTDALPWLISSILAVTGLQATTALAIWAGAFVPATVFVTVVVGRWLRDNGDEHPRVRDRIQLRAIVTTAFAIGFFAARGFVFMGSLPGPGGGTLDQVIPVNEVWVQGHHIHHFFFGFAIVAIAGWMALFHEGDDRRWTGGLYGIGLGLFIDEIGLLLTWGDYWARSSWFILAAVLTLLLATTLWSWIQATSRLEDLDVPEVPSLEPEA